MYLKIEFNTIQEYLRDLEQISITVNGLNVPSITYLAAAVSDFYITDDQIAEHKIQGISESGFDLKMKPVPKMMGYIKQSWNPKTILVSFKLETDPDLLA